MYLELKNVNKSFGGFKAADDVSFGVEKGKLVALLGPSGSGKTTLLRIIAGFETPDSGDIIIDNERVNDMPASKRGIGFVFQNYALFRYMTAFENIAFGLKVQKKSGAEIRDRVAELMKMSGLEGLEKRYPNQLSGGQRQRVAFARALAPMPHLLLLDEPFAAIDAKVRKEMRLWLKDMVSRLGITSIFVTHDQDEAVEVADDIIVTNKGRVEQTGKPVDIYNRPRSPFVAQFIGQSTIIENPGCFIGFSEAPKNSRAIIRPEFVEAFKSDNEKYHPIIDATEEGVINDIAFKGSFYELTLDVGGTTITVNRSLERRPIQVGEKLRVLIYRIYVFDDMGMKVLENSVLGDRAALLD